MDATYLSVPADVLLTQGPAIRALARALLRDEHLADDVVQETWLRFLVRRPRERAATPVWLAKVSRRLALEVARRDTRRADREESAARMEALPSVADEVARTEMLRNTAEAVLSLDEPYRTSLLLAYWRGWSARRIAEATGVPLATARSRLQRAHAKVRDYLDRIHGRDAWAVAMTQLGTGNFGTGSIALSLGTGAKLALAAVAVVGLALLFRVALDGSPSQPSAPSSSQPIVGLEPTPRRDAEGNLRAPTPESEADDASLVIGITGEVIDVAYPPMNLPEGPAADCVVHVSLATRELGGQIATREVQTDGHGRFALEMPDPGTRPLYARITTEDDTVHRSARANEPIESARVECRLFRGAHGLLPAIVVDDRGRALPGAEVAIAEMGGGDERVAISDDAGKFSLMGVRDFYVRDAQLAGYAFIDAPAARPLDSGGWTELVVRMGPEAALRVHVLDASGIGIPGARVHVELAPSEREDLEVTDRVNRSAPTDDLGVATIERAWAQRKLGVEIQVDADTRVCEAMHEGELVLTSAATAGTPIVLARGQMLELVARFALERHAAGRARFPDGSPAAGAEVTVTHAEREEWQPERLLRVEADSDGRFEGDIRAAELRGQLRVAARTQGASGRGRGREEFGDGGASRSAAARGEIVLDPSDAAAMESIDIVLDPLLSISGVVLDSSGAPTSSSGFGCRVWALPEGAAYPTRDARPNFLDDDGRFELSGLPPGSYDLYVTVGTQASYTYSSFLHRFPPVDAGTSGVELRLPDEDSVRIRVRISGGAPVSGTVLHRRVFPRSSSAFAAPRAEPATRIRGTSAWPAGASFGIASGAAGASDEQSTCVDGYDRLQGAEHRLEPRQPGWYVIGVRPDGAGGDGSVAWFPQATPILWFDAGEHTIEFELIPAATVRGRVLGDTGDEFLAVAIADSSGVLLPTAAVDGRGKTSLFVETTASGEFVYRHAPAGNVRVRVGSRAEIERGEFRREVSLELQPGENAGIELRL